MESCAREPRRKTRQNKSPKAPKSPKRLLEEEANGATKQKRPKAWAWGKKAKGISPDHMDSWQSAVPDLGFLLLSPRCDPKSQIPMWTVFAKVSLTVCRCWNQSLQFAYFCHLVNEIDTYVLTYGSRYKYSRSILLLTWLCTFLKGEMKSVYVYFHNKRNDWRNRW